MKRLIPFIKNYKREFIFGPFFKWLEAVNELLLPFLMAKIIDEGVVKQEAALVFRYGIMMISLTLIGYGFSLTCQYFASKASQGVGTALRKGLYEKIQSLNQEQVQTMGSSTLLTRITSDVNQIQQAIAMFIRLAVRAPFIVIGSTFMALIIDAKVTLIFLAVMIVIGLVLFVVMKASVPLYQKIQVKLDHLSLLISQNISGIRVIRAFSKQDHEVETFATAARDVRDSFIRVGKISALSNPLTYLVVNLGIVAVLWFGGVQVNNGALSQGQIIALISYLTQVFLAMVVVANLVIIFTRGFASAHRVAEILEIQPLFNEGDLDHFPSDNQSLVFDHVSFKYQDDHEVFIQDISFTLGQSQSLGIIGGTGSGKSTLTLLMNHIYQASSGKVLLNGSDIRQLSRPLIARTISVVSQQNGLYSGTIAYNLKVANPDLSEAQMWEALEVAQARDFVMATPNGLQTVLSQAGKNLSGGQKQRLYIARAICTHPQILVLDDSSSALDYATDAALRIALRKLGISLVIVSQRINSIRDCQSILVMDQGRASALGTHESLLASDRLYRAIAQSQSYQLPGGTDHE